MDLMQRQAIADDGEWHVLYENVNSEQIDAIQSDEETKELILSRDRGYALIEGVDTPNKPYLFIKEYNTEGFENFPIELSRGKLPQSENEIVISEEVITNGKVDYQIGDTLSLNIGERNSNSPEMNRPLNQNFSLQKEDGEVRETLETVENREYTIVGFIQRPKFEPTWAPGYTALSYVDKDILGTNEQVNASVILKKVNRSLFNHAEQ